MKFKVISLICATFLVLILGVALGSVYVPLNDVFTIISHKLFSLNLPDSISASATAILWNLRLPRALLAFIVGGALSVSGAIMQSVLRNPLASSYTLGVSSGASFGACLVIMLGASFSFAPMFSLPIIGFAFALLTILLVIAFSSTIDSQLENNTVILTGMVFSLFINALTTLLSALSREHVQRLVFWQMGSFAMKDWSALLILAPLSVFLTLFITHYNRELDIMTFGEDQAKAIGVNLKRTKWILLLSSAALTGAAIAFSGVIGFVDLVAPHIVRRIFGASHKFVIPLSALFGGAFMVACDLVARTIVSPNELPVGAVTAIIGAPFFAYIYLKKRNKLK